MQLHFREYGAVEKGEPVILLHGLFGSGVNWHRIARQWQDSFYLLVPDLRNHGRSPHADDCSFSAMAGDVLQLMDAQGVSAARLIGHSMGAKVAMWIALQHPSRCNVLVSADMAPVAYPDRFSGLIKLLSGIAVDELAHRKDADTILAVAGIDPQVRDYLLQNLVREGSVWRWRINLPALQRDIDEIMGFPVFDKAKNYPGPALFVSGGASTYVTPEHHMTIKQYFPEAQFRVLPGVGHWVYAEDHEGFMRAVESIL